MFGAEGRFEQTLCKGRKVRDIERAAEEVGVVSCRLVRVWPPAGANAMTRPYLDGVFMETACEPESLGAYLGTNRGVPGFVPLHGMWAGDALWHFKVAQRSLTLADDCGANGEHFRRLVT